MTRFSIKELALQKAGGGADAFRCIYAIAEEETVARRLKESLVKQLMAASPQDCALVKIIQICVCLSSASDTSGAPKASVDREQDGV